MFFQNRNLFLMKQFTKYFPKRGLAPLVVFSIPARGVLIGSKKWQKRKPENFQNLILNFTGLFFRPKKMAEKVVWDFCCGISEKVLWDFNYECFTSLFQGANRDGQSLGCPSRSAG